MGWSKYADITAMKIGLLEPEDVYRKVQGLNTSIAIFFLDTVDGIENRFNPRYLHHFGINFIEQKNATTFGSSAFFWVFFPLLLQSCIFISSLNSFFWPKSLNYGTRP